MRPKIYVAGPITLGDHEENINKAVAVGLQLIENNFSPLLPHIMDFCGYTLTHEQWMELDFSWLSVADGLYRIPGESIGADREEQLAKSLNIPIFYDMKIIKQYNFGRHPLSQRYHNLLNEIGKLHDLKQQDYGTQQDPFFNIRGSLDWGIPPWVGSLLRGNDKMKRLQKYAKDRKLANESVFDSLKDLAVYAIIAYVLLEEEIKNS